MDLYVVKLYDSCDKWWIPVSGKLSLEDAMKLMAKLTENGTKYTKKLHTQYRRGDYYMYFKVNSNSIFLKNNSGLK